MNIFTQFSIKKSVKSKSHDMYISICDHCYYFYPHYEHENIKSTLFYVNHYVFVFVSALSNIQDKYLSSGARYMIDFHFKNAEYALRQNTFSDVRIKKHIRALSRYFHTLALYRDFLRDSRGEDLYRSLSLIHKYDFIDYKKYRSFCFFMCDLYADVPCIFDKSNLKEYTFKGVPKCFFIA